ncbi:hypothetical protein [Acidovorax sp. 106]|uniref:hypothetical protein n=1 Tax=Acidovorax sp. 106 TaxID=2135637 RepID=UPI000F1E640D|nr:hypothetical protein [Acidovorax sp. 106]RLJ40107.1 hypothetical protein C8C98_3864 [Acidovorax sp. 106]
MRRFFTVLALFLSTLVVGCATSPQQPLPVSPDLATSGGRIAVAMTSLPKVDTQFPGASCLLCLAAASMNHQTLTKHVQTLSYEDLPQLKERIVKLLEAKGMHAVAIAEPLDIKSLPSASSKEPNIAQADFTGLKSRYKAERLLVVDISSLGIWRNYSAYIPTGDPKAVFKGVGYIVNLNTNALEWYQPVDVQKGTDKSWDEPSKFPGLTNAYFEALEVGKDALSAPFSK